MKRVSLIPEFKQQDFLIGLLILLSISWVYLYFNARKHRKKYYEMQLLALEKVKSGEVDKDKVQAFLKSAKVKMMINQYLLLALLFLNLGILYYFLSF